MALWTAFTIGLFGSLHCVGMCGPIALSLPYQGSGRIYAAGNVLLYNLGRVTTYSVLGLLIGALGKGIFLAGMQSYVSIGLGVLLILVALFSINVESPLLRWQPVARLNQWVKRQLGRLLRSSGPKTLYGIGLLNGLLPCGLVYMAVAGAVNTNSALHGAFYMVAFGLGTIPLMLTTALAGQFIPLRWRRYLRFAVPVFLLIFAALFIARGLQFEPPASIRFWENMQDVPMCH